MKGCGALLLLATPGAAQTLLTPALLRPPTGASKPLGWLKDELVLQAEGLTGQVPFFWSYINQSDWVRDDGKHQNPDQYMGYYLQGLVPLSYQLPDDANLAAIRDRYLTQILANQNKSGSHGWLGPPPSNTSSDGAIAFWDFYPFVQAFALHGEVRRSPRATTRRRRHRRRRRLRHLSRASRFALRHGTTSAANRRPEYTPFRFTRHNRRSKLTRLARSLQGARRHRGHRARRGAARRARGAAAPLRRVPRRARRGYAAARKRQVGVRALLGRARGVSIDDVAHKGFPSQPL